MKRNITTKLFIVTSGFLMLFIGFTMYFQTMFFEDFYTNRKMKKFEENVKKFNVLYSNYYISNAALSSAMLNFEVNNNAKMLIFDTKGKLKYLVGSQEQWDSNQNTVAKIFREWTYSPEALNRIISAKKTIVTDYYDSDFNLKNIICVSPIVINNNTTDIILAVSSLQPIEEAADTIREFYVYIFIGALILIILLSLIYSNMISKPLIILNKSASKMAEMDFSTYCPVKSDDELGNLAMTLNFLSNKLDTALKELKASNAKLKEDIERERHLDRMRKDFIAGVSHELKTPIALVSGYTEGLKDNIVDGEDRDFYLDVIMDETQKMSNLVSDMLDLSQLESGNFKLKPKEFALDELLNKVIRKHTTFINNKEIAVDTYIVTNLNTIADITRIEQVITNFLTNAIRHTPEHGYIRISAFIINEEIQIEIENYGNNIEPEDLKNIWDKFYKIDKSRARNMGGTGLGLSIVKNILLLHKSKFGVKNTEQGVCFYFTLKYIDKKYIN